MARSRKKLRSERNAEWIEKYCRIPEGKFVGRAVTLTKKQRGWLRMIYDSPTRTFILSMGRKNAKTAFSAFLLLLHLCGPEALPNSQLYSAAQSRDQAAILFSLAAKIVRLSEELSDVVLVRDSAKQLHCADLGTLYRALSAEASTSYGLSPVFVVHDELGQVIGPRSELYEALETAGAGQAAPISIIISTQARTDADLLSLLIDDALTGADPELKVQLYTAPHEDANGKELDPFAVSTIRLANPHYDDFMNTREVLKQAADAKRMPSKESSYRNLILNQRVEAKDPFVTRSVWQKNTGTPPKNLDGLLVFGGLDLSAVNDLTALELIAELPERNEKGESIIAVESTFWIPEEGLAAKSHNDRVPYDKWAEKGFIYPTPGPSIQYEFVAKQLRKTFDRYEIGAIAFDRYNMKFLRPWLVHEKFSDEELEKFVEYGQGFVSMSPAIRELTALLLAGRMAHGGHPVLAMCAANAVIVTDPAENKKFTKAKSTGRIDGAQALAMAVAVSSLGAIESGEHDEPFVDLNKQ